MATEAHRGLRGATGPGCRDRLVAESGNLRAALDWYIAAGDADAALSLASGMAWLWFITGDFLEGARWLGDALGAEGPRRPEAEAAARLWHGYCVGMSRNPAAGVVECEAAVAALRACHDRIRLAEALVICATVLGFAHHFERSLDALSEARDLLEPAGHHWLLGVHDLIVAWNLLSLGRLEDAEPVARSSLERFDTAGEVLLVVSPLNALASIAEIRGDLDAASAAYEALLARCRATGQPLQVPFSLVALATLRARQGDDEAADALYAEAIGCSFNPWVAADAMIGQAAVARRRGDLPRARALLDAAAGHYRHIDLPAGPPRVLAGLAWWALAAGNVDQAAVFAADAAEGASASGDPATQFLADTAVAAVNAIAGPTPDHTEAFTALVLRRAQGLAYRSLPTSQTWPRSPPASRCSPADLSTTSVPLQAPGILAVMQPSPTQGPSRRGHLPATGPAVEDHGRVVTANTRAAAWYRRAQRAASPHRAAVALRLAISADPGFWSRAGRRLSRRLPWARSSGPYGPPDQAEMRCSAGSRPVWRSQ